MKRPTLAPSGPPRAAGRRPAHVGAAEHRRSARLDVGWEALTTDGRVARVRPVRPHDAGALRGLGERISDRSLYLRFFSLNRQPAVAYLASLAEQAGPDRYAVVVEMRGTVVGVAGWERVDASQAEVALLVDDDHQMIGLGTLLLEGLAAQARAAGITELVADTLVENHRMLDVFRTSGLHGAHESGGGVVHSRLRTALDEEQMALADRREERSELASLTPLFAPRSVAVVGAGRAPGGVGHEVLRSILAGGYRGSVYVVNNRALEVAGLFSHGQIGDVPGPVDLAVLAVPADQLVQVLTECGDAGVRAAVILTSGLGELSPHGVEVQHELLRVARDHDIRVVGPNCIGLVNTEPDVRLAAWFGPSSVRPGRLAVGTQSGAIGIAIADRAARTGVGLAALVSLGNKLDVSGNDLLLQWWHDERVSAIGLYLESLGNPRKFARLAQRVGETKPVIVVKGGRSSGGRRAGLSHTAAAASPDTVVDALCRQAGVVRVGGVAELVDVGRLAAAQPLPAGGRLGIVGNGGGVGVLAADAAASAGLEVPGFSDRLRATIGDTGTDNPVDLGASAGPGQLHRVLELVGTSGEVDALLVSVTETRANDVPDMLAAVGAAELAGLPVMVTLIGADDRTEVPLARGDAAPVFDSPEPAVRALAHLTRYARWRRRPRAVPARPGDIDAPAARAVVDDALAARPDGGWLDAGQAGAVLASYGIGVVPSRRAATADEAVAAARALGYPVVLKTDRPEIVHKSDVGGVRTELHAAAAVRRAFTDVTAALGAGLTVQPQVRGDVELVVGLVQQPLFGPVLMVGLGGVFTDLLGDRSFRLLPITREEGAGMLRSLRAAPLLLGYRGAPPVDVDAVADLLVRVSALASDLPELVELDLNPVMVTSHGQTVVDAKLRVAPARPGPEPMSRAMRTDRP